MHLLRNWTNLITQLRLWLAGRGWAHSFVRQLSTVQVRLRIQFRQLQVEYGELRGLATSKVAVAMWLIEAGFEYFVELARVGTIRSAKHL